MEYAMRKIIIGVIFLFLIKSPLISAYTLPLEADMLVFLPDRVGEYMVSDPYGMGMFVDNPNTNPMYNNARYAFRTYVKDDKEIFASIVASTVITGDETTEDMDCDYNTDDINIQGFDGYAIEIICKDGQRINSIIVNFIDEEDFIYALSTSSSYQLNNSNGLGNNTKLVNIDELYNFTNMLDLTGMSSLIK